MWKSMHFEETPVFLAPIVECNSFLQWFFPLGLLYCAEPVEKAFEYLPFVARFGFL